MIKSLYFCIPVIESNMKRIFIVLGCALIFASCSSSSKDAKTGNDGGVSNDLITNPATASDPQAEPSEFAVMSFKNTEHNFGDILEHQKVETTFEFTNTGKVDLLIQDCKATCGCTVPDWPKEPIKPGQSGKIRVVFDSSGKSGLNNKNVTVIANIKEKSIDLKFTANVRAVPRS